MGSGRQQKRRWVVFWLIAGRQAALQDIAFLGLESVSLKNVLVQPRPPKFSQICMFITTESHQVGPQGRWEGPGGGGAGHRKPL
jgi:hypothetical protein